MASDNAYPSNYFDQDPPLPPQHQSRSHPSQQSGTTFSRMQQQRLYPSGSSHQQNFDNNIPLEPQRPMNTAYSSHPRYDMAGDMSHQTGYHAGGQFQSQPMYQEQTQPLHPAYHDTHYEEQQHNRSVMPAAGLGWDAGHTDPSQYPSQGHNEFLSTPTGSDEWDHPRDTSSQYTSNPFQQESLRRTLHSYSSSTSQDALTSHAVGPALNLPPAVYPHYNDRSESPSHLGPYRDGPGQTAQFSRERLDNMVFIDPNALADDGDDGLGRSVKRNSKVTLGRMSNNSRAALTGVAGASALGTGIGALKNRDGTSYSSVPVDPIQASDFPSLAEKSAWAAADARKRKRRKIILFTLGVLLVLGIIAATVIAIIISNNKKSTDSSQSAAADDASGDLSKDSAEIKALLNNPNLHKVFAGMAYTPFAAQYPACLTNPPSQNNVTRDMAVMSQLTNTVRTYGTDCNQTEMVLHAIDRLGLTDMKIWLGVWLENNGTTNDRQIATMWNILDTYGTKQIKGVVVGNEVLYRKDLTPSQLGNNLTAVKNNMTSKGYNLPVATSDLGDNWTASLASEVDVVMSNIHPFFAGVTADQATSWAYDFWQTHDVSLTTGTTKSNIISEIGWPSQGGTDCGAASSCTTGATAGIDEMNTFLSTWVCQALSNGTDYFWFEAFDEPWKIQFDQPGQAWEDHWGLFDINRNLKDGLTIPNCGGKTVAS